jgi:hypothetical protein
MKYDVRQQLCPEKTEFLETMFPLVVKHGLVSSRRDIDNGVEDALLFPNGSVGYEIDYGDLNRQVRVVKLVSLNKGNPDLFDSLVQLVLKRFDKTISISFTFPEELDVEVLQEAFEEVGGNIIAVGRNRFSCDFKGYDFKVDNASVTCILGSNTYAKRFFDNVLPELAEVIAQGISVA